MKYLILMALISSPVLAMGPRPPGGPVVDTRVCAAIQLAYTLLGCQTKDHEIYDVNSCQSIGTKSTLGIVTTTTKPAPVLVKTKGK